MKTKRLEFLDIAKGLLILMVIIGHFKVMAVMCYSLDSPVINDFSSINHFWVSFFMPAFFIITGFCSSFEKEFKTFLWKSFRTILFPAILFSAVTQFFVYYMGGAFWLWNLKTILKSVIINGAEEYWFCNALFIARLMCWVANRLKCIYLMLVLFLILGYIGINLYNFKYIYNYWSFQHAFVCVSFMWVGHILQQNGISFFQNNGWRCIVIYLLLYFLSYMFCINIPAIHNKIQVNLFDYPYLLALAFSGSIAIIYISSLIEKWGGIRRILAYMGRCSLVLYLSHFIFYRLYIDLFYTMLNKHNDKAAVATFMVFTFTIISCCIFAEIINLKPFRWIIGK